ncbi:MAG TPA: M23 family metallopeptidase [Candidatus Acidoferrum sp.]|nr:M23 family metallopeptidase [Candidatus Acidoferrum sp.]
MGLSLRRNSLQRISIVAAAVLLAVSLLPGAYAQTTKKQGAKTKRATAAAVHDCGNGIALRLTSSTPAQGGLLELTVTSAAPIGEIKGDWAGHPLPLWAAGEHAHYALLGIDLERAPGKYELSISGQSAAGDPATCTVPVDVKLGHFAVESLKVAPGFVELSPEDRARADTEGERVHAIFAGVTPERLWAGNFRMPLYGNRTGHNFGKRRVLNGKQESPHTGLDIPAPAGTPIHAAQRGRVALAQNLFFSGNTVILDHGLGVYTFYGHMKSIAVAEGDEVNAGTILGLVGMTGRATGPHLHWSLLVNGARVNPLGILRLGLR